MYGHFSTQISSTPAASTNLNRRVIKAWEKSYGKPANSQQRFYQALLQELWRTHPGGGNKNQSSYNPKKSDPAQHCIQTFLRHETSKFLDARKSHDVSCRNAKVRDPKCEIQSVRFRQTISKVLTAVWTAPVRSGFCAGAHVRHSSARCFARPEASRAPSPSVGSSTRAVRRWRSQNL